MAGLLADGPGAATPGGGGMSAPLAGVRVTEFTWVIAGPMMTKYLALLGAEVIRVESQKRPEFRGRGGQFAVLNDNKKSCRLDLSQPRAQELARQLVRHSDVVVENFGTGVVDRLGLDYQALRAIKPDLVMLSCSGLGRTGPDRDKLAYGTLLQLMAGWSLIQGHPGTEDVRVGGAWTDPLTAATGAFAILAALHHRRQSGEGQFIDLSMVEATLCGIPEALMDYSLNQRVPIRMGNRDPIAAPHGCYPCRGDDRWIAISVADDAEWQGLRRALGHPLWTREERFADSIRRKHHEDELDELLARWTSERTPEEAMSALQAAGVPAGPSMNVAELVDDPHLRDRGLFVETEAPLGGKHLTIGAPWRIEPGLTPTYTPAPRLGQDDEYVFKTLLGLSDAEIAELVDSGVIY